MTEEDFDAVWKRVLAGEIRENGPVLAADGRQVQAKRGPRGEMLLAESEAPWLRSLVAEARHTREIYGREERTTSRADFLAILGGKFDDADPVHKDAVALWDEMEALQAAIPKGTRYSKDHGPLPPLSRKDGELRIEYGAYDLAARVLARHHVEVTPDWRGIPGIVRENRVDRENDPAWKAIEAAIRGGVPFKLDGETVLVAMRRMKPNENWPTKVVPTVHESSMPVIKRALSLAADIESVPRIGPADAVPTMRQPRRNEEARIQSEARQGLRALSRRAPETRSPQPHTKPYTPPEDKTATYGCWDGGKGKLQLLAEDGRPWAVALGKGDPRHVTPGSLSALAARLGVDLKAGSVGAALVRPYDVPSYEPYRDGTDGVFLRANAGRAMTGGNAFSAMHMVAKAERLDELRTAWSRDAIGMLGWDAADKEAVEGVAEAIRSGSLALVGSEETGPILVLADRVDHSLSPIYVTALVKGKQNEMDEARHLRVETDMPAPRPAPGL